MIVEIIAVKEGAKLFLVFISDAVFFGGSKWFFLP